MNPHTHPTLDLLARMETAGIRLRDALAGRNAEAITSAVAEQEALLQRFQELLADTRPASSATDPGIRALAATIASRVRAIHRTNRNLAFAFLKAIDRTLMHVGELTRAAPHTYGASGMVDMPAAPLFVHQKG
jgi:hypothetical protein